MVHQRNSVPLHSFESHVALRADSPETSMAPTWETQNTSGKQLKSHLDEIITSVILRDMHWLRSNEVSDGCGDIRGGSNQIW